MIRRPPRSTLDRSSAASDVFKRQAHVFRHAIGAAEIAAVGDRDAQVGNCAGEGVDELSLIHISEPTRPY